MKGWTMPCCSSSMLSLSTDSLLSLSIPPSHCLRMKGCKRHEASGQFKRSRCAPSTGKTVPCKPAACRNKP